MPRALVLELLDVRVAELVLRRVDEALALVGEVARHLRALRALAHDGLVGEAPGSRMLGAGAGAGASAGVAAAAPAPPPPATVPRLADGHGGRRRGRRGRRVVPAPALRSFVGGRARAPGRAAGPRGPGPARRRCGARARRGRLVLAARPALGRGAVLGPERRARLAVAVVAAPPRAARLAVAGAGCGLIRRGRRLRLESSRRRRDPVSSARRRFLVVASTSADTTRGVFGCRPRGVFAPRAALRWSATSAASRAASILEEGWFASAARSAGVTFARALPSASASFTLSRYAAWSSRFWSLRRATSESRAATSARRPSFSLFSSAISLSKRLAPAGDGEPSRAPRSRATSRSGCSSSLASSSSAAVGRSSRAARLASGPFGRAPFQSCSSA